MPRSLSSSACVTLVSPSSESLILLLSLLSLLSLLILLCWAVTLLLLSFCISLHPLRLVVHENSKASSFSMEASENRGPQVTGVAAMFLTLSTIAILMRVYCRVIIVKNFGFDDYFAVAAWVFFACFCGFAITGVTYGTGQHADMIPPRHLPIGLKWWWACEPAFVLSNMSLKISIGIFLLRIAVTRVHRMIIWAVTIVNTVYAAFFFFLFVLQCRPSAYFWTRFTGATGTCINPIITVNATYAYSAIACLGDWTLGLIPIFLVWNLQMNPRTKLSVALILAMGSIASTATIIRIPYVKTLKNQADFLYATTDVALWSLTETGFGITASALATMRPLFRNFLAKSRLLGSSTREPSGAKSSNPWPGSNGYANGYVRSSSHRTPAAIEELALTSNARRGLGVTTVVESSRDGEEAKAAGPLGKAGWGAGGGVNVTESKQSVSSNEEEGSWRGQSILKTTKQSVVVD